MCLLIAGYDFFGELIKNLPGCSFRDMVNIFRRSQEEKNILTMQLKEKQAVGRKREARMNGRRKCLARRPLAIVIIK